MNSTEQQLKMLESIPSSALKEVTGQTDLFGEVENVTEYSTTEAIPEELINSNRIDGSTTRPQEQSQQQPNYGNIQGDTTFNPSNFISPALAVQMIDTVFPMLAVVSIGFAGYEVNPKSLKMTAGERKIMEEPTGEFLNTLNIKMSPLEKFLVCLAGIYSSKALEIVANGEYQKKGAKKKTANMLDKDFDNEASEQPKKPKGRPRRL